MELLVVIGVLFVLVALFLPWTHDAVAQARSAACLARLHGLHMATLGYATDHDKILPRVQNRHAIPGTDDADVPRTFANYVMPYVDERVKYTDRNGDGRVNHLDTDPGRIGQDFFRCPAAWPTQRTGSYTRWILDYGINVYGRGNNDRNTYGGGFNWRVRPDGRIIWTSKVNGYSNPSAIYLSDSERDRSPESVGGASTGRMDWPIRVSFDRYAFVRHRRGYNSISLNGAGQWLAGNIPANERWFTRW